MTVSHRSRIALCAALVAGAFAVASGQEHQSRAEFMRGKLRHSKDILDGLAREDYAQIAKGAGALKAMRGSPEWAAMSRPEAGRYRAYSLEFQELTERLLAKAEARNIDGAALAYVGLMMNCVNCHKELRSRHS
jgi:hypothetical protein